MDITLRVRGVFDSLDIRSWSIGRKFVAAFCMSFLLSFVGDAALYFGLRTILVVIEGSDATPIGYLFRMFMYPDQHPFQYLAVVALPFAFLTAVWTIIPSKYFRANHWQQIVAVILLSLIVSSILGGLLWTFHDMQAGYFPSYDTMVEHFLQGAWWGLTLGPLIVTLSIPMNFFAFVIAYNVASFTKRICPT